MNEVVFRVGEPLSGSVSVLFSTDISGRAVKAYFVDDFVPLLTANANFDGLLHEPS